MPLNLNQGSLAGTLEKKNKRDRDDAHTDLGIRRSIPCLDLEAGKYDIARFDVNRLRKRRGRETMRKSEQLGKDIADCALPAV